MVSKKWSQKPQKRRLCSGLGRLEEKKRLLQEQFGLQVPEHWDPSDESVGRLFWYRSQQSTLPGELQRLSEQDVLGLVAGMDTKVGAVHQLMLETAIRMSLLEVATNEVGALRSAPATAADIPPDFASPPAPTPPPDFAPVVD